MKGVGKECAKRLGLGVDGQIPLFHHSECYWDYVRTLMIYRAFKSEQCLIMVLAYLKALQYI